MQTRTKWAVAGATSILGLGTVFGAVSAANALDLDRSDDVQPTSGIVVGDLPKNPVPGSAVTPSPEPVPASADVPPAPAPVAPATPVAPSGGDSPVSAASPASAASPVSAISAVSADS